MALRITDPAHLALHRGIRAAIALPLTLATALYLVDDPAGAIFAVFGTVGLLVNADFAGSNAARTTSYLLTGVAGSVALALGWAASFTTVGAVVGTILVAFGLAFANILRGRVAVATPAVLLIFVVAVSIDPAPTNLPAYLLGWWLAVVVSTLTALLLLPRNQTADQRAALADAFAAAARAVDGAWVQGGSTAGFAAFMAAVDRLDAEYGGKLTRAAGVTRRDQALALLIDHADCARLLLTDAPRMSIGDHTGSLEAHADLARAVVAALDDVAAAMRDPGHLPTATRLDAARVELTAAMETWVLERARAGVDTAAMAERIGADHALRMTALMTEQIVELARVANDGQVEDLERLPPIPFRPWSAVVRSQLHLGSPWLRNALRSALGLGIAVLIVKVAGVQHGFWVLLGVVSVLRFDAVGTRRFAFQAVVGTVGGVLIAAIVLTTIGTQPWVLWVLLPPVVFLAAWSGTAINYPIGQAAFSALVLIALGIIQWPPQLSLGLIRIEDVLMGATVALVVGLLLWPRGALGSLNRQLAVAVRAAEGYLVAALGACVTPASPADLERQRRQAAYAAARASETFDLSMSQRGPIEDLRPWAGATTATYLLVSAARVIAHLATTTPSLCGHTELGTAIERARADAQAHWGSYATVLEQGGQPTRIPGRIGDTPYPTTAHVESTGDARALVTAVWAIDWVRHLDRLATSRPAGAGALA